MIRFKRAFNRKPPRLVESQLCQREVKMKFKLVFEKNSGQVFFDFSQK